MGDAQPALGKLLLLSIVQHHAVRKPAVALVPLHHAAMSGRQASEAGEAADQPAGSSGSHAGVKACNGKEQAVMWMALT